MLGDGIQLTVQPLFHDLRQRVAVHFLGTGGGDANKILLRAGNAGREGPLGDGPDIFNAFRDFTGVINDDLPGGLLRQIVKFLEHLPGGAEVKRRLVIGILKAHTGHQYFTEPGVLFLQKVDVAGRHNGLAQLLSQLQHGNIQVLQVFFAAHLAIPNHEHIITQRLHL